MTIDNKKDPVVYYEYERPMIQGDQGRWKLRSRGPGLIFNAEERKPLRCKAFHGISVEINVFDGWSQYTDSPFFINATRTKGNYLKVSGIL